MDEACHVLEILGVPTDTVFQKDAFFVRRIILAFVGCFAQVEVHNKKASF